MDGDSEIWISGDWLDADDMNQDKNCKWRSGFGQKIVYIPFPQLPRWRWKCKDERRDEIIELLPKLLQGLSSAWDARIEQHQGIKCAKFMEVTARR